MMLLLWFVGPGKVGMLFININFAFCLLGVHEFCSGVLPGKRVASRRRFKVLVKRSESLEKSGRPLSRA